MAVYVTLLGICCIFLFLSRRYDYKFVKIIPYISMSFVCGFRGDVGIDTLHYYNMYTYIERDIFVKAEPLYYALVKVAQFCGLTQQFVFLIMSLLTSLFIYKFIRAQSVNFQLSTIIYLCIGAYYFTSFNTIREALAVAIFLYSIKYIDKSITKFAVCILLASGFHFSVVLAALLLIIFRKLIFKPYILIIATSIMLIISLFKNSFLQGLIILYFDNYANYITYKFQEVSFAVFLFAIISIVILVLIEYYKMNVNLNYICMLALAAILIIPAFWVKECSVIFIRLSSYFTPVLIVLAPIIGKNIRPYYVFEIITIVVCICYYLILTTTNLSLINYNFNFDLFI